MPRNVDTSTCADLEEINCTVLYQCRSAYLPSFWSLAILGTAVARKQPRQPASPPCPWTPGDEPTADHLYDAIPTYTLDEVRRELCALHLPNHESVLLISIE